MEPEKPLRSQPTRDRILAAASEIFARDGYEAATIRKIAAAADINPSMVMRYFGSKEDLFSRVAKLDFQADLLADVPRSQLGEAMIRHVIRRWEDPEIGPTMAAILRACFGRGPAQERASQLWGEAVRNFARELGLTHLSPETGPLISTQLIGLGLTRYVLKVPPVVALPEETIIREVGRSVQQYIDAANETPADRATPGAPQTPSP
jgi:AcrR family transcriptional regulator